MKAPQLGQIVKVYGQDCRIITILPMGTIEVERLDGKRYYRLSGYSLAYPGKDGTSSRH